MKKKNQKRQGLYRLAKNLQGKHKCQEKERIDFTVRGVVKSKCKAPATHVYYGWRWGVGKEPAIVSTETLLCTHCARVYADSIAEAAAEAAVS